MILVPCCAILQQVLKKADMIRKNAVESILAERDILITVRNPFVVRLAYLLFKIAFRVLTAFLQRDELYQVRFFYSFTCSENLYLVMEYLNGGDLYSLLRNLGCLDEEVARVYIAEVVINHSPPSCVSVLGNMESCILSSDV